VLNNLGFLRERSGFLSDAQRLYRLALRAGGGAQAAANLRNVDKQLLVAQTNALNIDYDKG